MEWVEGGWLWCWCKWMMGGCVVTDSVPGLRMVYVVNSNFDLFSSHFSFRRSFMTSDDFDVSSTV